MSDQTFFIPKQSRELSAGRVQKFILMALPGKELEVVVRQRKRQYTDQQRKCLWGHAYRVLAEFQGLRGHEELEELHLVMCGLYWGWKQYSVMGVRKKKPVRTTTRDENGKRDPIKWDALADFYGFIEQRAAEIGCAIPTPDAQWFMKEPARAAA